MNEHCTACGQSVGKGDAVSRMKRWLVRRLSRSGTEGLSRREIHIACASKDRQYLPGAIAEALREQLVYERDGRIIGAVQELDEEIHPRARIAIATAPWFGSCEPCDRRELGVPKPELVGRLLDEELSDPRWLCAEHLEAKLLAR